jgi:fatty acid desaturase
LSLPGERKLAPSDQVRIASVRAQIHEVTDRFKDRHPWIVKHQNTLGLTIFCVAILGVLVDAALFIAGVMPWWLCIPVSAFWLSLLHELEHDLIHSLYFRRNRKAQNLMLLGVWIMRPSTINPWTRRRMHLHHHRVSGTESDLEERGITNGEEWNWRRALMTGDGALAIYLRPYEMRKMVREFVRAQAKNDPEERARLAREQRLSYFPLGMIHYALWHAFLIYHAVNIITGWTLTGVAAEVMDVIDVLAVTYMAPNALRTFCLHLVSSNMHYFGDVEPGNVLQQTQVWTSPWLWPLHAFCFNFGSTHAIHHFVVGDTFYVRQAIARDAHSVLRENGVRFNDFDTFRRANRRGEYEPA